MEGVRGIMFRIPGTLPGGDCLRVFEHNVKGVMGRYIRVQSLVVRYFIFTHKIDWGWALLDFLTRELD